VIIDLLRSALADAAARGQVHPDAATDAGLELLSIMHFGIITQHLANDPHSDWDHGRYTRRHREILPEAVKWRITGRFPSLTAAQTALVMQRSATGSRLG
jgi:hypothetical protein